MPKIHEIVTNNDQTKNLLIDMQGRIVRLHSSRPLAETEKIFSQINSSAPAFFIGGLGCGYLLEKILQHSNSPCLIYEPISPILDTVLSIRPELKYLLNDPRVILVRNLTDLTEAIQQHNLTDLAFTINRSYSELFPQDFQQVKEHIAAGIRKKEVGNATLLRFGKLWTKNILRNLHRYFTSQRLNSYHGWAKNKPAIIIGAGPSLAEAIPYIKQHIDKAVLIACDTALPMLYHAQITPDFVVTVDPQEKNSLYLRYTPKKNHYLIADPSVHDSSFEQYNSNHIILTDSIFPLYKPFEKFWGQFGILASGGSVSTSAFDFARQIHADPIIMVGQDLAFSQNKTHNNGNILTEFSRIKHKRLNSFYQQQAFTTNPLHAKHIKGRKPNTTVLADARLILFKDWFCQEIPKTSAQVIVAGMEGAYLEGAIHTEIYQAFSTLVNTIQKVHPQVKISKNHNEYKLFLQEISKQINKLLPICQQIIATINKAQKQNNLELAIQASTQLQELLSSSSNHHISLLIAISLQHIIQHGLTTEINLSPNEHIELLLQISKETFACLKTLNHMLNKAYTRV